ncbi:MAG: transposase [Planctomycetia bacterium]
MLKLTKWEAAFSEKIAMIHAYHVIFGAYGFWLPNDPRGSWSDFVAAWELFAAGGKATKVHTKCSLASVPHDHQKRLATKEHLKHPPVKFTDDQIMAVGRGFATAIEKYEYILYACSIMPEHVHLVIGRYRYEVEKIVQRLKQNATMQLDQEGLHPKNEANGPPTPWSKGCWKVFLNTDNAVRRAIAYAEENPLKEGKSKQTWPFIAPYLNKSS